MITVIIGVPQKPLSGERVDVLKIPLQNIFDEIKTPSLFGDKKVFILKNVFEDESIKDTILDELESFSRAPHDIVVLSDTLLIPERKKLEKFATILEQKKPVQKQDRPSAFALANAFATGDKKNIWITFHEVVFHDDEMEKLHGMIWWKLKDMMTKKSIFSRDQLDTMARDLVRVYHDARLGKGSMKDLLELFFLQMPQVLQNKK